jgi:hypothetical protein
LESIPIAIGTNALLQSPIGNCGAFFCAKI